MSTIQELQRVIPHRFINVKRSNYTRLKNKKNSKSQTSRNKQTRIQSTPKAPKCVSQQNSETSSLISHTKPQASHSTQLTILYHTPANSTNRDARPIASTPHPKQVLTRIETWIKSIQISSRIWISSNASAGVRDSCTARDDPLSLKPLADECLFCWPMSTRRQFFRQTIRRTKMV